MIKFPNYDDSLLSLINSIEKHYGIDYIYSTLEVVDSILEKQYKNVIIMVFDALGSKNLQDLLPEDSFLRRHQLKQISSVFPPTTTAATTTIHTGLPPALHSWLGWSLHFEEVNDNVNIFINTNDSGQQVAEYHVANQYISFKGIVEKINEKGLVRAESISAFGTYRIETFEELLESVETLCKEEGRHYLSTYWHEPDYSMHSNGVTSDEVRARVERINAEAEALCNKLEDTVIFITADHGHIDGRNEFIGDYPELLDTLKWLPSIEPRALAFFVKEGRKDEFREIFLKNFQDDFLLLTKEEVLESKLFGTGHVHPRFESFLGDYLAIATGNLSIFNTIEETQKFVGVHAGLTEAEMMIPLIVVEKE